MLYPKLLNIKRTNLAINIVAILSIITGMICFIINGVIDKKLDWSFIVLIGIVYSWITVLYSIRKNANIASHMMIQTICASIVIIIIDRILGYRGWSISIGLPIIVSIANLTMFVLVLVNHKRYFQYTIYHLIIFILSMVPLVLLLFHIIHKPLFTIISSGIAIITLLVTIFLCGKDLKEEIKRFFHI